MRKIYKYIATLFIIGYIPYAQGTIASALAAVFYILFKDSYFYYLSIAVILVVGFWSSERSADEFKVKDPPEIVIDEFSSMLLVNLFMPYSITRLITGFVLFRVFDILKTPPLRKLESLPKGSGIMMDDIGAAIYANLILQILSSFHIVK